MNSQRRRLNGESRANNNLDDGTADTVIIDLDEGPSVNVHGLRVCGSIEPENADANANGFWIVYCFPANVVALSSSVLANNWTSMDDEDYLPYVWGVGCWTASNQAPYHFEFNPRTSRTCQNGARLVGVVVKTGISAGNVRINLTMTCFTSN